MIQKIKNNPFAMNSIILFGGSMIGNVLNYVFHLAIGRMVSVEIYGEVESIISLINILAVPAMTLTFVATKFAAHSKADRKPEKSREIMNYLNKKVLKYGLPLFILALLLTPYVKNFIKIESNLPIIFLWIMMFLSFFTAITGGMLNGWQKFKKVSFVGIFSSIVKLVSAIILIFLGFELNGIVGSFLLGALASYIASLWTLKFIFKSKKQLADKNEEQLVDFGSIKKYILPTFLATLTLNIMGNIDMVMAKHNLDALSAGQYGALTIVSRIIFFVTGVIATVLFSMSSEQNHQKGSSSRIMKHPTKHTQHILSILFGAKYSDVSGYLGWFAILVSLYSFVNLVIQYLLSVQATKFVYGSAVIALLLIPALFLVDNDIYAILKITIIAQLASLFWGLLFLYKTRKSHAKVNLSRNSDL